MELRFVLTTLSQDNRRRITSTLLGRGSAYTATTFAQAGAGFVSLPITTRLVAPDQYGLIAISFTILIMLGLAAAAGLEVAIGRAYFRAELGPHAARRLLVAAVARVPQLADTRIGRKPAPRAQLRAIRAGAAVCPRHA